ncbi:hypothetical protein EDM59_20385 [Brevibacillus nitrificans]|uniref:ATP-binding protein n=1 Tax=Brevibacillus nitrificans TaxID=651560 RepID=A0A3M8D5M4_9BACL|nr:BREX system ATP-binding domain-containing protein [Brevibacillus nitrificans]RNB82515.1 hypothetical protein EDM59_20385 [Brevibacillus nitrificans]
MKDKILTMLESMASHGTAPEEGCSLFGVGYDDAFSRLQKVYLKRRFDRGASAEKFVVGPFGSGKSHFLHHLMEIARGENCVTAKVLLNKDVDFTQNLVVFKEVAKEIRLPHSNQHGIGSMIQGIVENIKSQSDNPYTGDLLLKGWISGLEQVDFRLTAYGKMLREACSAYLDDNRDRFDRLCQWLGGEMDNRELCKELQLSPVTAAEKNLQAKRAMFSLFQFVKHAGYQGTVVCFDEAEQGFAVDKKKMERIHSMLMANINSIVELNQGSVLLVYALTPDVVSKMDAFAALQQRIADPAPNEGFFDGNTFAPLIDLTKRSDMLEDLREIGEKLVQLMYEHFEEEMPVKRQTALERVRDRALRIVEQDLSSSTRRTMVKEVCTMLLRMYDDADEVAAAQDSEEDEV